MIRLLDLAADAATFATEHLLVAAARLHDHVSSLRARLGTPRHCPACLVVAPRGDACACAPKMHQHPHRPAGGAPGGTDAAVGDDGEHRRSYRGPRVVAPSKLPSAPGPASPGASPPPGVGASQGPGAGREARCTCGGGAFGHLIDCPGSTWGAPPDGYSKEYVDAMNEEHGRDHV